MWRHCNGYLNLPGIIEYYVVFLWHLFESVYILQAATSDGFIIFTLQWRHNEHNDVSNHRRLDCLLNCLLRHRSKNTLWLRVTGFREGNPPVTSGFPSQRPVTRRMFPFDDVIMINTYWSTLHQYSVPLSYLWAHYSLTHWGRDKIAANFTDDIFKYIFLNENVWKLQRGLFISFKLTIVQHFASYFTDVCS